MKRLVRVAWLAFLLVFAPVLAYASDDSGEHPPRDVGVVVQPSGAPLPPAPSDFERLDYGWLVLEVPASVHDRVDALVRDANAARTQLSEDFGQPVLDHVVVRVTRDPDQMTELAPRGAPPPPYATGVAYPSLHVLLLALQAPETWEAPDLSEVLRHELAHVALNDAIAGHDVPLWFNEGVAIHESGEVYLKRWSALWNATLSKRLIPLADLDREFPRDRLEVNVAYAEAADVIRFLMRDADRARFGSLVQRVRTGTPFDRALEDAYGTDVRTLEYQWREEVGRRFGILPALTGGGLLWVGIAALSVAAWMARRKRAKAKLAQWAREEAEAEAALAAARAQSSGAVPLDSGALSDRPAGEGQGGAPVPVVPVVEHEGRFWTVH